MKDSLSVGLTSDNALQSDVNFNVAWRTFDQLNGMAPFEENDLRLVC